MACAVLAGCGSTSPSTGPGGNSQTGDGGTGGGSDAGTNGGADGGAGACKFTVSGAMTLQGDCDIGPASYDPSDKVLQIQFSPGDDVNSTCGTFSAELGMNPLAATTYTYAHAISASAACMLDLGHLWQMNKSNPPDATKDQGNFTLVISDPGPVETDPLGSHWAAPHGTLSITMPAGMGQSGTATLQATF